MRVTLVGVQFEGAISDDSYDRSSLAETERNIQVRLNREGGLWGSRYFLFIGIIFHTNLRRLLDLCLNQLLLPIPASMAHGILFAVEIGENRGFLRFSAPRRVFPYPVQQALRCSQPVYAGGKVAGAERVHSR